MKTVNYKIGQTIKIKDTVDFTITHGLITGSAVVNKYGIAYYPVKIVKSKGSQTYKVRSTVNIPLNSWKFKVTLNK